MRTMEEVRKAVGRDWSSKQDVLARASIPRHHLKYLRGYVRWLQGKRPHPPRVPPGMSELTRFVLEDWALHVAKRNGHKKIEFWP